MAKSKETFAHRQRERDKKAKAEAKRERRHARRTEPKDEPEVEAPQFDQDKVLADLSKLHAAYEDEQIGFDDFEEKRTELLARLQVD